MRASEFLFIAGQLSADRTGKIVGVDDFDAQCVQVFANIEAALASAGAGWGNVVQFTTYLVPFAGHPEIHDLSHARISAAVSERRLSAQHAPDGRPAGAGAVPGRRSRRSRPYRAR
ncbi:MAG: RidA family protein [Pseudomonadota bacterium]